VEIRALALIALIGVAVPTGASADPANAKRASADAEARAKAADFFGAAAKYREAFREHPRPDFMCNVGVAYYKAKDLPRAHRYLDQCLSIGASLDPAFIANVKTVLAAVEKKLASDDFKPISLVVQPDSATTTFDGGVHDEPLVGSRRIWLPFGHYRATVHAEGYSDRVLELQISDRSPAEESIKLTRPRPGESAESAAPVLTAIASPGPPPPAPRASLLAPVVASSAAGALGGVALGFYVIARGTAEPEESPQTGAGVRTSDTARGQRYAAWAFAGVAGVTAIVAGALWYRRAKSSARIDVQATAQHAGATFSIRW
jgi:hypothetical protein